MYLDNHLSRKGRLELTWANLLTQDGMPCPQSIWIFIDLYWLVKGANNSDNLKVQLYNIPLSGRR